MCAQLYRTKNPILREKKPACQKRDKLTNEHLNNYI